MKWNEKTTAYFPESQRRKLEEIENYLSKQEYFSNENLSKSRIIHLLVDNFYELFVKNNSRTKYPNRLDQLKKIKPKDNEKLLRDINQIRQMQDIQALITLANYQNLVHQNDYDPRKKLRSFNYGDSKEINVLMNRILQILREDVVQAKQIKDANQKKKI
ncbi:hypothetical protein O2U01_10000 (plasmid) [Ligilactobacillus salivarius]|uniref:Uncharacterized protein n=1 Tax=Ligilactobacillus salivarius TaxID=1624 RepID=A0ABD7YYM7_9LACO|nr:hypothetical protein [Ligilactobacillus salivarius]WHS04952.1 hypothetical protein O2U07_00730 [Ligilactobacillus salivarius]WHS09040.1 hypothetical protein O2U05_11085 [Ligilactobacillus salivarius]WHS11260.1 hypothetical protein O2U04_10550 [Ligilactobacillus salivarius]WHS15121.1 hypothetical protein O2U03_10355 [Ligilactobacillus salivarius]WHS18746.1 hypothetical protein O2U02_09880 [Ligilactobacillus salivarius]